MKIEIFGRKGCEACSNALALLDINEIPYFYYDITNLENYKLLFTFEPAKEQVLPVVVINSKIVGSYPELKEIIE